MAVLARERRPIAFALRLRGGGSPVGKRQASPCKPIYRERDSVTDG
jgi:hypothetical protein